MDPILDSIIRAVERIRESGSRLDFEKEIQKIAGRMWEIVDEIEGDDEENRPGHPLSHYPSTSIVRE